MKKIYELIDKLQKSGYFANNIVLKEEMIILTFKDHIVSLNTIEEAQKLLEGWYYSLSTSGSSVALIIEPKKNLNIK